MNYEIFDNFLPEHEFKQIQYLMTSHLFPWYPFDFIVSDKDAVFEDGSDASIYDSQMVHIFYANHTPQSNYYNDLVPLISKINPSSLVRIKANLGFATPERVKSGFHIDFDETPENFKTAVYYLNTNNGSTLFEDGTEIESVENRLVVFDTNLQHTGVSSTDSKFRYLINLNYYSHI
jgi:hypothetical protein